MDLPILKKTIENELSEEKKLTEELFEDFTKIYNELYYICPKFPKKGNVLPAESLKQNPNERKTQLQQVRKGIEVMLVEIKNEIKKEQKKVDKLHQLAISIPNSIPKREERESVSPSSKIQDTIEICSSINKIFKNERSDTEPLDLYDTIIVTKTFADLIDESGWEIKKRNHTPVVSSVVSILGNYNKGKSWILSFLSNKTVPTGFNIHTKGVSCIYPNNSNSPVTYLDSAGFDEPLRISKGLDKWRKKSVANGLEEEKSSEFQQGKKIDESKISQMLKDKQYVENFIQSFLLDTADVIIIAVGQLTFSDQKLVNRIKKEYNTKKIFIIHNFFTLNFRVDVERFIKKDIENSFDVDRLIFPVANYELNNNVYYREKGVNDICHIIMGRDGMESGSFYNETAKEIIISSIKDKISYQRNFNIEESLQEYLKTHFPSYVENNSNYQVEPLPKEPSEINKLKKSEIKLVSATEDNSKNNKIKIREDEPISQRLRMKTINLDEPFQFKKANVDEFGFWKFYLMSTKSIELPYHIYETETAFIWEIEASGVVNPHETLEIIPDDDLDGFYFKVKGKKEPKKDATSVIQKVQFGQIEFITEKVKPLTKLLELDLKNYTKTVKDGVLVITWPRKNREKKRI